MAGLTSRVSLQLLLRSNTSEGGESEPAGQVGLLSFAQEIFQPSWSGLSTEGGLEASHCTADDEKMNGVPIEGEGASKKSFSPGLAKKGQQTGGKPLLDTTAEEMDEVNHPMISSIIHTLDAYQKCQSSISMPNTCA